MNANQNLKLNAVTDVDLSRTGKVRETFSEAKIYPQTKPL